MINRMAASLFTLGALIMLCVDGGAAQPVHETKTEHVDFASGGTIRVKNSIGSLEVEGWDQSGVELTVVKSAGFTSKTAEKAHFDAVHVAAEHGSDRELVISTSRPASRSFRHPLRKGSGLTVEYHLRAPRNSRLVIDHAGGDVSVIGMTGDIEAGNRRGDIVLMLADLAAYSIDAHTKLGVITSDGAAATHERLRAGENLRQSGTVGSHKLVLRMGFGGIAIKELPHEALASDF
jgi:hypothetical protein